jgi:hypothetical protein
MGMKSQVQYLGLGAAGKLGAAVSLILLLSLLR